MPGPRSTAELRRLQTPSPIRRHVQTHLVSVGRLRHAAYRDGEVLRSIVDDTKLAHSVGDGKWSRFVKVAPIVRSATDNIKPLGPAVVVALDKGQFY